MQEKSLKIVELEMLAVLRSQPPTRRKDILQAYFPSLDECTENFLEEIYRLDGLRTFPRRASAA